MWHLLHPTQIKILTVVGPFVVLFVMWLIAGVNRDEYLEAYTQLYLGDVTSFGLSHIRRRPYISGPARR